jgi:hypothetical protein
MKFRAPQLPRSWPSPLPRLLAGADPAHALELTKGRGQHGKRHVSRNAAMADYIAARIEADPKPRGAVTRALNAAPDHFGTKKQPLERIRMSIRFRL